MALQTLLAGLGLWLLVFLPSSAVASLLSKTRLGKSEVLVGAAIQACFIAFTAAVVALLFGGDFRRFGFTLNLPYTALSAAVALPVALALAFPASRLCGDYRPPFLPKGLLQAVLLMLFLAPLGEETVFRGLLEGYLLTGTPLAVAVAVPAALFALVHLAPFSSAPRRVAAYIVASAFVLGLIAGYYRAVSQSLAPAVVVHAAFNLVGLVVWRLSEK